MYKAKGKFLDIPPIEIVSDDLKNAGLWWIISSVVGFSMSPIGFFFMLPFMSGSMAAIYGMFVIFFLLIVISVVFTIVTYLHTMRLEYFDELFKWGGTLGIVGVILSILGFFAIMASLSAIYLGMITVSAMLLVPAAFGGILLFVAIILFIIGFYRLGTDADNSLVKIGGILLIIVPIVGGILVGIGLRQIGDEIMMVSMSAPKWDEIREELNQKLENGETVALKYYAISRGLNPLILKIKISEWSIKGELKGFLYKEMILPKKT